MCIFFIGTTQKELKPHHTTKIINNNRREEEVSSSGGLPSAEVYSRRQQGITVFGAQPLQKFIPIQKLTNKIKL